MTDVNNLGLFILAGWLLNLTPGPDVLFIVSSALRSGAKAGVVAALGITAGCFVHIFAAALGVSALMAASSTAFTALKWAGAAYLFYVGLKLVLSPGTKPVELTAANPVQTSDKHLKSIFFKGFLTNTLNPKVALFFLAFVPQFIVPGASSPALAFGLLGMVFIGGGLGVCLGYAWLAALAAARFSAVQQAMGWVERTAGALFIALGIRLAFSDNPST